MCCYGYLQDQYEAPPPPPIEFPKFTSKAKFGAEMKERHFFLDVRFQNAMSGGSLDEEVAICVLCSERLGLYKPWSLRFCH